MTSSCDLVQWDLEKIEYSNYEVGSNDPVGFSPLYNTVVIENDENLLSWAGRLDPACGLINYFSIDSTFNFNVLQNGYQSNVLYQDFDTLLMVFNAKPKEVLVQSILSNSLLNQYSDLDYFVNMKLGSVVELAIHDIVRFEDKYFLVGQVKQTIGEARSILIALTRSLEPLWVRTYISNSIATNIEVSPSGEVYLSGIRNGHAFIIRTNIDGSVFEIRDYTILGRDSAMDMIFHNGTLFYTSCLNEYPFKTRVVSFSNSLDVNWFVDLKTIDTNHSIIEINRNQNVVIGYASYSLVFLTELDRFNGGTQWCNRFSNDSNYAPKGILQTSDFGYFLVSESTDGRYRLFKTDEEGATRLHPFLNSCL